jgi:hypothetical protein
MQGGRVGRPAHNEQVGPVPTGRAFCRYLIGRWEPVLRLTIQLFSLRPSLTDDNLEARPSDRAAGGGSEVGRLGHRVGATFFCGARTATGAVSIRTVTHHENTYSPDSVSRLLLHGLGGGHAAGYFP